MLLNNNQATMFADLHPVLTKKWGLNIGYYSPRMIDLKPENDFLVVNMGTGAHLISGKDALINFDEKIIALAEELQHEEEVQAFWNKIESALWSGELYFNPGITRHHQGVNYKINLIDPDENQYLVLADSDEYHYGFDLVNEVVTHKFRAGAGGPVESNFPEITMLHTTALRFIREQWPNKKDNGNV